MRGSAATMPCRVWRPRRVSPCTQYCVSETGIVTPSSARANFDGMSGMIPRFILIASWAVARRILLALELELERSDTDFAEDFTATDLAEDFMATGLAEDFRATGDFIAIELVEDLAAGELAGTLAAMGARE